ncbi:SUKH-3 domain-containing protein [Desulfobacterales bacterium HSG2]|nr:SUKH-3 domain-containing protein [Desulfobacterales bacterium HSG2]
MMLRFSEKTLQLLRNAGWSEDRHFSPADEYTKALEHEDFYVSDAVREFLYKFGGLSVRHPHAKIKEKTDYFHFDVIRAINSGDPGWVSEEYSPRIGKELCVIGEAFRRSMVLCMSPDKSVYAGADENLFFIAESGELAIESLCNGDELKEIPEENFSGGDYKMADNRKYIPEIIRNIREINPYKIILFGSYANGVFSEDSDLDLVVVLDSPEIAKNYEEKMRNRLLVRRKIYELSRKVPVDLVVYTKGEYDIISESGNSFYNEIKNTGKVLYEKTN